MSSLPVRTERASANSAWAEHLDGLSEEELIALKIKLFELPPKLDKHLISWVTGITVTDYYDFQDPKKDVFDIAFPSPLEGRRSDRSPRRHCTLAILRWDIRRSKPVIRPAFRRHPEAIIHGNHRGVYGQ